MGLLYQPYGGTRPREPELDSNPEAALFIPPPDRLDKPQANLGIPLYPFTGYVPNRARMNASDINPNSWANMHNAYDDGVQLYNGVDGITSKRFGPSQFYVISDAYPGQDFVVPSGHQPKQVLTASDIQNGPARRASLQSSDPGSAGGPVFGGGIIHNPGGC